MSGNLKQSMREPEVLSFPYRKMVTLSQASAQISEVYASARNTIVTTKLRIGVSSPFPGVLYSGNQCGRTRVRAVFYDEKKM